MDNVEDDKLVGEVKDSLQKSCEFLKSEMKSMYEEKNNWKMYSDKLGVKCFKRFNNVTNQTEFKGLGYYKGRPEPVINVINTSKLLERKEFDPVLTQMDVVKQFTNGVHELFYLRYESPSKLFFADRDFVVLRSLFKEEELDEYYIPIVDFQTKEFPLGYRKNVRVEVKNVGWALKYDRDRDRTFLMYVCCCDFGGWIPKWIINLTASRQPLAVLYVKNIMEEQEENENKDYSEPRSLEWNGGVGDI